jgi:hypothetical protein
MLSLLLLGCTLVLWLQKLKVWSNFIHLPHRHAFDRMSLLPECLPYPLKNLSLSAILSRVTEKHPAFG